MASQQMSLKGSLGQLETVLDEYFGKKAPALPANIKEILVKIAPYLTLLGVILAVPALLSLFGMGAFLSAMPYGGRAMMGVGYNYYMGIGFLIIMTVMEALAIPGLFARTRQGWNWIYYSTLVNVVSMAVSLNIVGLIIGTVIGMYLLFQVRTYYK